MGWGRDLDFSLTVGKNAANSSPRWRCAEKRVDDVMMIWANHLVLQYFSSGSPTFFHMLQYSSVSLSFQKCCIKCYNLFTH